MSSAAKLSRSPCTSLWTINFVPVQMHPERMRNSPARESTLRGRSSRKQQAARNSRISSALPVLRSKSGKTLCSAHHKRPLRHQRLSPQTPPRKCNALVSESLSRSCTRSIARITRSCICNRWSWDAEVVLTRLANFLEVGRAWGRIARTGAENTPLELEAARTTETQERARYQAGLATLVDVSDAQSFFVQAEIDDALARLAVWQNLASVAAAQGDLSPFLRSLHDKTQGTP